MKIENLDDFLFCVQPMDDYSIKSAMRATGLTCYKCKKYLDQAVEKGLYKKRLVRGDGASAHRAHRFLKQWYYDRIKH